MLLIYPLWWMEVQYTAWCILVKKKLKLNVNNSLDLTTNLQQIEGSVNHADWHVGMQSAKTSLCKQYRINDLISSTKTL